MTRHTTDTLPALAVILLVLAAPTVVDGTVLLLDALASVISTIWYADPITLVSAGMAYAIGTGLGLAVAVDDPRVQARPDPEVAFDDAIDVDAWIDMERSLYRLQDVDDRGIVRDLATGDTHVTIVGTAHGAIQILEELSSIDVWYTQIHGCAGAWRAIYMGDRGTSNTASAATGAEAA